MKKIKNRLLRAALFVIIAGLVTISCTSEPDPVETIEDWNIELKGGELWHKFNGTDDPRVVEGKTYTVTLTIENCDEDFPGSHIGAKLCYYPEDFDDEKGLVDKDPKQKQLSGWIDSEPDAVIEGPFSYTWTFKAGQKNKDDVECVDPATTPADGVQFFYMQAQDENYKKYPASFVFHIKGSLTLEEEETFTGTLTNTKQITMDFSGSDHDANRGIGNIQGDEFTALKNATPGAVLRVYVENCNIAETPRKEKWAIGSIGNFENIGDINPNAKINIPSDIDLGQGKSFTCDVRVSNALKYVNAGDTYLFVNIWDADQTGKPKIAKIELWEYQAQ